MPSQNPPFPSFLTGATSASASRVGHYGAIQMLYYYYYIIIIKTALLKSVIEEV